MKKETIKQKKTSKNRCRCHEFRHWHRCQYIPPSDIESKMSSVNKLRGCARAKFRHYILIKYLMTEDKSNAKRSQIWSTRPPGILGYGRIRQPSGFLSNRDARTKTDKSASLWSTQGALEITSSPLSSLSSSSPSPFPVGEQSWVKI